MHHNDTIYKINPWNEDFYGFPFQKITDEHNNDLKVVALSAPLYETQIKSYYELEQKGYKFIGISSYGFFPIFNKSDDKYDGRASHLKNQDMKKILAKMKGWLYCNRNPNFLLKTPKLLFSESDTPSTKSIIKKNFKKEYDIVYSCGSDSEFHKHHKNWELAKKCFKKMTEINLKIIIFGREKMDDISEEHPNITLKPYTPYWDFLDYIEKSKICFFPNIADASPRILTESIMKGTPVLVNKNIFGGWKYICDETGMFFEDENDVIDKIKKIIAKVDDGKYDTRDWFIKNYYINDVPIAGIKLKKFIDKVVLSI
jgi:hypothetical protein